MANLKVAVFDTDKEYRERFSDYLMSYKADEIELAVFNNPDFLYEALNVDKFQLIVLGCGYEEVINRVKEKEIPVLILTEWKGEMVQDGLIFYLGKYQSMDVITKRMQLLAEVKPAGRPDILKYHDLEIVGVFSPVRHEMQMLFSLLYGKNAGGEKKVLYISLLAFSGFVELFGQTEYDLGDVIVQLRGKGMHKEMLKECIYEREKLAYISPFTNPEDVRELSAEDVRALLKAIEEYTDYRMVIFDIGININGLSEVLQMCQQLFCLEKQGYLFETQTREFLTYLEKAADIEATERLQHIRLPCQTKIVCGGENLLEQLDWGEFGDFVRSKL